MTVSGRCRKRGQVSTSHSPPFLFLFPFLNQLSSTDQPSAQREIGERGPTFFLLSFLPHLPSPPFSIRIKIEESIGRRPPFFFFLPLIPRGIPLLDQRRCRKRRCCCVFFSFPLFFLPIRGVCGHPVGNKGEMRSSASLFFPFLPPFPCHWAYVSYSQKRPRNRFFFFLFFISFDMANRSAFRQREMDARKKVSPFLPSISYLTFTLFIQPDVVHHRAKTRRTFFLSSRRAADLIAESGCTAPA